MPYVDQDGGTHNTPSWGFVGDLYVAELDGTRASQLGASNFIV